MSSSLFDDEFLSEPIEEVEPLRHANNPSPNEGARIELAVRVLRQAHEAIGHVISLLEGSDAGDGSRRVADLLLAKRDLLRMAGAADGSRTIEGVFNGMFLIGPDGMAYPVPPNYASKSRIVEGDVLKLVIRSDGTFVFKQIGPIERRREVGTVALDPSTGTHVVICGQTAYKVLPATISFYRADIGDEAVILLPKSRDSVWAAVENIVKKR